jgi:chromatin remodeling complex protein RSC6
LIFFPKKSLKLVFSFQDPENKQFFTPDKKMAKVFGTERMRCFAMSKFLSAHLS